MTADHLPSAPSARHPKGVISPGPPGLGSAELEACLTGRGERLEDVAGDGAVRGDRELDRQRLAGIFRSFAIRLGTPGTGQSNELPAVTNRHVPRRRL